VSVFELTDHPQIDVRLGDTVLIPDALQDQPWAGRVCGLRDDGFALVENFDGTLQWHNVWHLVVVDDGDGSEGAAEGEVSDHGILSEEDEDELEEGVLNEDDSEWRREEDAFDHLSAAGSEVAEAEAEKPSSVQLHRPDQSTSSALASTDGEEVFFDADEFLFGAEDTRASAEGPVVASQGGGSSSSDSKPSKAAAEAASGEPELLAFDLLDEDCEPRDHFLLHEAPIGAKTRMIATRREMQVLRKGLGGGSEGVSAPIVVRAYASRSDLFRAMVVGPPDTPYEFVPFFFDLALPAEYPREPPLAHFHAHFVGNERLNPNLYVDGKVCLSLLGTWSGPSWDPQRSTLLQVLVSLQGLVLVEEPYYNEPGHECDAGTEQGKQSSALYNEHARLLALRAALNVAQNPPGGFREIVETYFATFGPRLLQKCEQALEEPQASQNSAGFRKVLKGTILPRLRERWGPKS